MNGFRFEFNVCSMHTPHYTELYYTHYTELCSRENGNRLIFFNEQKHRLPRQSRVLRLNVFVVDSVCMEGMLRQQE